MNTPPTPTSCRHDYERPVRKGRARYHCPLCDADISLEIVMLAEAEAVTPVSLGHSCSTKDAITAYWQEQVNYPFDWAFSPKLEGVIRLLETRLQLGELKRGLLEKEGRFFTKALEHQIVFLHHDIVGDPQHAASIQRKCERLVKLLDSGEPVLFLRNAFNPEELLRADEFTQRVQSAYPKARFCIEFAPGLGLNHTDPGWKEFIEKVKNLVD
jgi:hypothetical protein